MTKGYEYLSKLFDDGIFTEIGAFGDKAEAVAGHGTVALQHHRVVEGHRLAADLLRRDLLMMGEGNGLARVAQRA